MSTQVLQAILTDINDNVTGIQEITPIVTNPNGQRPALTYSVRDGFSEATYRGSFSLGVMNIDINLFASDYTALQSIKYQLMDRYNGFSGALGDATISRISVINAFESYGGSGTDLEYQIILEFEINF